jgi:hypothetical protein
MKTLRLLVLLLALPTIWLSAQSPGTGGLDPAAIKKPLSDAWTVYSGDYTGRRFSALKQVDRTTVKNLALAWVARLTAGTGAGPAPPGAGGGPGGGPRSGRPADDRRWRRHGRIRRRWRAERQGINLDG